MTRMCILLLALVCLGADIAFGADEPPMLEALLQAEPPDGAAIDDGGLSGEMRRLRHAGGCADLRLPRRAGPEGLGDRRDAGAPCPQALRRLPLPWT